MLPPGSRLGPYEVLAPLGAGGMGEVYRARDPRLRRDVALKVLPPEHSADPQRLRRFEQEARTVASLNHPHILGVFDIGTHDGTTWVAFELLEGRTLRLALASGALPPRKVVDYGVQVCRGLAAAHDRGVVHRDLKPENLFLAKDGQVKILDFGLAKLAVSGEETDSAESRIPTATGSGVVLGTAGYMSPEQARGQAADARSDLFALGAVLYEMLSGERAFPGDTPADTLSAILHRDPPTIAESAAGPVPAGLERVVRRCLEKDPQERFQTARDVAFALEAVSGVSALVRPATATRRRRVQGGVIVALAAMAGLWIAWPREPVSPPLRVRPITSTPGVEGDPALSPDGHQVAFVSRGERTLDLYVKLIDGGEPLLLSRGDGDSYAPAWSPDGTRIAFLRHEEGEDGEILHEVLVVPALGGAVRRLATSRAIRHALDWSPDGGHLAINDREPPGEPEALFLLSLESGERRRLTRPPAGYDGDSQPRFSPDGRTLAFVRQESAWENDLYLVSGGGGEERRLTAGNRQTDGLDWTPDGRAIVFSSRRAGGAFQFCLWKVPVSGGDPEPLEFGENGWGPSVSREGGRLAYTKSEGSMDIWRVGGPSAAEDERPPTPLIASTREELHPEYSPDGKEIAFTSGRSGALEIWVCENDGSHPRQLSSLEASMTGNPKWSPDGETIAFFSTKEGSYDVWVVSASGGLPHRLTTGPAKEIVSSWSRDGRWVYFCSNETGRSEVWKVPAEAGAAVRVTAQGGCEAIESHDGRFLYFTKSDLEGPAGIWRIPRDGGEEIKILDWGSVGLWTVLEQGLLGVRWGPGSQTLELFPFSTQQVSRVAELDNLASIGLTASPDGRWVLYVGGEEEADVMLVENFR